jgi:short-subunit dehydrogenase
MRDLIGKRYWLVGASEGLGRALAEDLSRMGVSLVLSARNEERLNALAAELPGPADVVPCDISDSASCADAFAAAGDIDGMVFLAGVYWPVSGKDAWDVDQVTAMADINFTGALRVLAQVVPAFVARDAGHIVLTGSLSGFRGLPGAIGYSGSKAAVMSTAETLHSDLRKTGVDVQLVNPGFIRTRLTEKNDFSMPFIMDPDDTARVIVEHMMSDRFQKTFPKPFSWLFRLTNLMPDWLYFRVFKG